MIDRRRGLAAVFDGVGGANAGEVASQLGAQTTRRSWKRMVRRHHLTHADSHLPVLLDNLDMQTLLHQVLEDVQKAVSAEGDRRVEMAEIQEGKDTYPETTAAVAVLCQYPMQKSYQMTYAHVGDSRIYLLRSNERLRRLTFDDGYTLLKILDRTLNEEDAFRIDQATHPDQLSEIGREIFSKRNGITQSLGHLTPKNTSLTIHTAQVTISPGDRILLCSDGIHDNLLDAEIEAILQHRARTTVAHHLVQRALKRSREGCLRAKHDDMSAIVITCNF